jgi:molecular chaperone DnaJ
MKNYYEILGVGENSTQDEIKKTYKKLSKQYHPDVNPSGEEKFKEISEAYDILGDDNKRRDYDQKRKNPFGQYSDPNFDFNSIFEQMMGGNGHKPKPADKIVELFITPEESFNGVEKTIEVDINKSCNNCNGTGGTRKVCTRCNGSGYIIQTVGTGFFKTQIQSNCFECKGVGEYIVDACGFCYGNGVNSEHSKFNVKIPSNVDNGDFMRMKEMGDEVPKYGRGDLILKIVCEKQNNFEKSNKDLIYYLKLNLKDLLINEQIEIPHPDGPIKINLPENLDTDKPLRILSKGYKTNQGVGNFYIKISVVNDIILSKEQKEKIVDLLK